MGLKSEVLRIKDIMLDQYIRLDTKYRIFSDKKNFNIWDIENTKPLSYYIQPITSNIVKKGELEEENYLIDLKSIERKTNTLIDIELVDEIGSDKVIIEKGDLVIPKMEPKKGQLFLNLNHQKYLGSTELIEYKINLEITNPKFLYYVLVNTKTLEAMSYLESGKTHRRVQSFDLLKIQIPTIPLNIQNEIVKKLEPIEQEIQNLKSQKKEHLEIIN
ncbi:MAG: restriction endonuclease subunit S, partial [Campylobacterales bacterium]|nr:restriction endonuclease subunit S [Campylobacterales bacterium]